MKATVFIVLFNVLFVSIANSNYNGNYALSFDGVDDYVSVPQNWQDHNLNDLWTLEAWINPAAEQNFWQLNVVGYPQRHPNMNYCGKDNPQCQPGAPLVQLRDSHGDWFPIVGNNLRVTPNQWTHIAGTWNNATLILYVNGELDVSLAPYSQGYTEAVSCKTSTMFSCDAGLQIGGNYFRYDGGIFSSQYFRGLIDEVRVWNFGRSQDEIRATMRTGLIGTEPGLIYYWRFDDYGGQTTKSSAFDLHALLGGGYKEAEPQFVISAAPLSAPPGISTSTGPNPTAAPIIIEKNSAGAVTAGALIGIFCLLGGIVFGVFVGWKTYGKRIFSLFWSGNSAGESSALVK